ncbi:MAG: hypothetical protein JJE51_00005, partial [Thermoanaerobaculia bacterium]|nr:hypothetical protein [Thermoanaerobaculia bacterium]
MGPESPQSAPYRELAARVADRLESNRSSDEPLAPWPEEVIVSSGGVAGAIAAALLAKVPQGVAALRMQSLETLAQRIVNEAGDYPRLALEEERRLAMRLAVRDVDHPMMETRGAAAMLERSYRDVRDSGLTLTEFLERVNRTPSLRSRDRIRTVTRAWVDYERLIRRLGAIDPADLLARATSLVKSGARVNPQIVAGFYDMTGAQQALIAALPVVESWSPAIDGRAIVATSPEIVISEQTTREEEARAVCIRVAQLLASGTPVRSIGIVARSLEPYDVHLFHRFAREAGFTATAPEQSPLTAHRIGRALTILITLRERDFPRTDVLELIRSGLRLETRINADKADVETRRRPIAGGTSASLRDRATSSLVLGDYVSAVAELETITAQIDERWLARTADLFRVEDESDLAALDAIDRIAAIFQRATAWNRPFDASALLDILKQAMLNGPRSAGVWLGDVMSFRGRSFEHLFAVRMQDSLVPQRRVEDPLLTDSDRRALGLREIGNGRDEERLLFDLIIAGAGTIHFSYSSSDGFGTPLRASQYLKALAIEREPEKKHEILKNFSRYVAERHPERFEGKTEDRRLKPAPRHARILPRAMPDV